MNMERTSVGWDFWLAWFSASAIGFGLGTILGLFVAYGFFYREGFDATIAITFGIVAGAMGGFMQWLVLRKQVARSGLWVLATALGFGIALGTSTSNFGGSDVMVGILVAATFGIVGGIMQWLILSRAQIARAGLWICSNLLGSLPGAIGIHIANAIGATGNYLLSGFVFGLLFGVGLGAINGAVMVWLLRQSPSSNIEGMATAH